MGALEAVLAWEPEDVSAAVALSSVLFASTTAPAPPRSFSEWHAWTRSGPALSASSLLN